MKPEILTHFTPAQPWPDDRGLHIQAHGGGFIRHGNFWYWIGEYHETRKRSSGMACYRSRDLLNWEFRGLAIEPVVDDPSHPFRASRILERPKVIRNPHTGKFVMWIHAEGEHYNHAHAMVAMADQVEGPYEFVAEFRPEGAEFRDMSLFVDEGIAYVVYASNRNHDLHIDELTDDYLDVTGRRNVVLPGLGREAPVIFPHGGRYFLLSSGVTGYTPNAIKWAVADEVMGKWTLGGNLCAGLGSESGFHSQPFAVLPMPGLKDAYLYVGDHWNFLTLLESSYVPLPLVFDDGVPVLRWREKWSLDIWGAPSVYTERPKGSEVVVPYALSHKELDLTREPLEVPGGNWPATRVWLGWNAQQILLNIEVEWPAEPSTPDSQSPLWRQTALEVFLNYYQLVFMHTPGSGLLVAGGLGLDESLNGVPNGDPHLLSCIAVDESDSSRGNPARVYQVTISREIAPLPEFTIGSTLALALVVKYRDPATDLTLEQRAPEGHKWGDTDTFHRAVLAPSAPREKGM